MHQQKFAARLVRAACIFGAVLDAFWAVPMMIPDLGMRLFGLAPDAATPVLRYILGVGAALMAGWTVLLIWAALKPLERRAVVLFTLIPVKLGLDLASLPLLIDGIVTPRRFWLMRIDALAVYGLFLAAWLVSSPKRLARKGALDHEA